MAMLRKETIRLKKIADKAEVAAGIFRPESDEEGKKARMQDMEVIRAVLVSAKAGEKEAEGLDWAEEVIGAPLAWDQKGPGDLFEIPYLWSQQERFSKSGNWYSSKVYIVYLATILEARDGEACEGEEGEGGEGGEREA